MRQSRGRWEGEWVRKTDNRVAQGTRVKFILRRVYSREEETEGQNF